jgi:quinol-cytochrome oxidoreductase complex cytochrome b subunit
VEARTVAVRTEPVRTEPAPGNWLDERLAVRPVLRAIFLRHVPQGLSWWYSLGAATLFVLSIQFVTGVLLALYYAPTPEYAYDSVQFTMTEVPFGWFVRGLHHWGASAMVVLVLLHMLSAFVLGAHRYPREATWLAGVALFVITLAFGFTGYLLPWDQKAYWATTVGTNMAGTVPVIGQSLVRLLRGASELGAIALSRFYALHVLVLPGLLMALVLAHLALVIYHGVSVPPGRWHRGSGGYRERYAAAKAKGPSFWPDVIVDDLRLSALIFVALVALTVFAGVPMEDRADPTDTSYIPRPEWYFLFLFQLLKYFPGSLEWLGVVVVPGLLLLLLVLAPWLSRGEERRPLRRPIGMAVVAGFVGLSAFLTYQAAATTPPAEVIERGRVLTSLQLRGKQLIAQQGCTSCHVINGEGETKKGPPLDGVGDRLTAADVHFFMERPNALNPAATMKALIPPLSHEDVEAITQYLLTLDANPEAPAR